MSEIKTACASCKKIFCRSAGRFNESVKRGWKHYCSKKCEFENRITRKKLICENCGKKFERMLSAVSAHNYCSHSCAAIIVNRNWTEKRGGKIIKCENCKKSFKPNIVGNKKYCSMICFADARLYSKEKLLEIIMNTAKKLKRVPAKREFFGGVNKACVRLFGSWNNAISAAGFTPNRSHSDRMYKRSFAKADDGHLCDSISELLIDNWLFKNKILHKRDACYPNTNHKADWAIIYNGNIIFVEYFGLANDSPRYDRCIKEKINLCAKNKIFLIAIYPKDLYPKNFLEDNLKTKFKKYLFT